MKTIFAAILATFAALGARAYTVSEDLKTYAYTVTVGDKTYVDVLGSGDAKPGDQWGWSKDVVFDGYVHNTYRIASVDGNSSVAYTLDVVPTGTPTPRGLVIIFK